MLIHRLTFTVSVEKDAMAISKSPLIVKIYYCLQETDSVYLIMEYVAQGCDLQKFIDIDGFVSKQKADRFSAQIILALEYIHKRNIIHR